MGNLSSAIDPIHVRMYGNMIQIADPLKRIQIIQTCLASIEYVNSAKRCGVYSYLLHYISSIQTGSTPPLLPGENGNYQNKSEAPIIPRSVVMKQSSQQSSQQLVHHHDPTPSWKVITETPKQKAISYFSSCLEVLGIQEEVALTEESLKKAYKRMAIKAHPDKGGSEEYFEAVTRAYAYLSEIIRFMKGGKKETTFDALQKERGSAAQSWMGGEPVRLNAKNLDMNTFNKLFQETHVPDPDSDGYGDWLKGNDTSKAVAPMFKGEFNRDVFNRMFDDESKKSQRASNHLMVHPGQMALTLNPTHGVNLVGDRPDSYTAAPNSRFQFTDLRGAYTSESTISDKVSNVAVGDRNFEQYRASREKAPDPFTTTELHGIQEFEERQKKSDLMLERRRAEMAVRNQQYHDQMKRMVITEGVDLNQKKIGY